MRDTIELNKDVVINHKHQSASTRLILTYIFALASSVVGFLIVVIFSGLLQPDEWGVFSVAKRSATIIATIAIFGVTDSISRYIPLQRARESDNADYFGTNATYIIIRSSCAVTVVWLLGVYVLSVTNLTDGSLLIALVSATVFYLALMWHEFLSGFLRAEGFIGHFNVMRVMGQSMQLLFGLLILFLFGASANKVILGSALGIGVVVAVAAFILWRLGITVYRKRYVNREIRKEISTYGIPRMIMIMFEMLIISLSLLLLGFVGKPYEAGLFAISMHFIAIMVLFFKPIAFVMLPEFSKLHGMQDTGGIENKLQILIQGWLYIITFTIVIILSFLDVIFDLLFKVEYAGATGFIKILLIGMIPFSFYLTTYSYINAILKRPYGLYILLIGIVVNIVLFFILVTLLGGIGSAVATAVSMVVVGSLMVLLLLKNQPRVFRAIHVFDFIICILPLAGILIASYFVYDIILLIGIAILFLGLHLYLLKKREIAWFALIEKRFFAWKMATKK